jgi:hypothetical protein
MVCGGEYDDYRAFERAIDDAVKTRGMPRVEALRTLACRSERMSRLGDAVALLLYKAACDIGTHGDEETLVRLVESGRESLIFGVSCALPDRRPPSAAAWQRIRRVAADRTVDTDARCAVLETLPTADSLIPLIANDPSDPAQYCAARIVVDTQTPSERQPAISDVSSPYHAAAVIASAHHPEPPAVAELCRIVRDPQRPRNVRLEALFAIPSLDRPEVVDCLESLLDPRTWISADESMSTLNVVVSRYEYINPKRAFALGRSPLVSLLTPEQQDDIAERVANLTDH